MATSLYEVLVDHAFTEETRRPLVELLELLLEDHLATRFAMPREAVHGLLEEVEVTPTLPTETRIKQSALQIDMS